MVYFWYFIFNPLTVGIHLPATELEEQGLKLNAKKKKKKMGKLLFGKMPGEF